MESPEHDVIVVGAGNAALCAALSAREHGASVVVLECAPEAEAGGNSRFAGGVMRFAFDGVDDLRKVADLTDEEVAGADFGTYTRAQYFDDLFRLTQYRTDPTLVELLVLRTVRAFNGAVRGDVPFDPYTRDGRGTVGLEPAKSNWANAIDQPPFEAYATTCGITFTFGGLRIDADGQVLDHDAAKIAGLYAAGEMVGGIFYFNYPSGAGLVSGAVFGRLAGASAARCRGAL